MRFLALVLALMLAAPVAALATAEATLTAAPPEAPAAAAAPAKPAASADPALATDAQKAAYALGQQIGRQLHSGGFELDLDALFLSIGDVFAGRPSRMSGGEMQESMGKLQQAAMAKEKDKMDKTRTAAKFNAENGERIYQEALKEPGVVKTASGLAYKALVTGTGAKPTALSRVRVHYRGTFTDGTEFDSSYGRGEPAEFPLNGVIKGWTEGVQLMPVGSKFKFWIPPDLAYGPANPDNPRPTGVLIFEVELLAIL